MLTTELARRAPDGVPDAALLEHDDAAELESLARLAWGRGRYDDARAILHGLLVMQREDARLWGLLGAVEHDAGNLDAAWAALALALELAEDVELAVRLIDVHLARNDLARAEGLLTFVRLHWIDAEDERFNDVATRIASHHRPVAS